MRLSETFGLLGTHKQLQTLWKFLERLEKLWWRVRSTCISGQFAASIPREQPSSNLVTAIPTHVTIRSTNIRLDQWHGC